jgi:hypothetical protein
MSGNGRRYHALTEREKAFCRHRVAGHNGKESAIKAGFSRSHAKQYAHTLMQRQTILDEIERLRGMCSNAIGQALTTVVQGQEPARNEQVPLELRKSIDAEIAAGLDRSYCIAGLVENAEICLGRRKVRVTKTEPVRDRQGRIVRFEPHEVEVLRPDAAGANQALDKLAKLLPERLLKDSKGQEMMSPEARAIIERFSEVSRSLRKRLGLDDVVDIEPADDLDLPDDWGK